MPLSGQFFKQYAAELLLAVVFLGLSLLAAWRLPISGVEEAFLIQAAREITQHAPGLLPSVDVKLHALPALTRLLTPGLHLLGIHLFSARLVMIFFSFVGMAGLYGLSLLWWKNRTIALLSCGVLVTTLGFSRQAWTVSAEGLWAPLLIWTVLLFLVWFRHSERSRQVIPQFHWLVGGLGLVTALLFSMLGILGLLVPGFLCWRLMGGIRAFPQFQMFPIRTFGIVFGVVLLLMIWCGIWPWHMAFPAWLFSPSDPIRLHQPDWLHTLLLPILQPWPWTLLILAAVFDALGKDLFGKGSPAQLMDEDRQGWQLVLAWLAGLTLLALIALIRSAPFEGTAFLYPMAFWIGMVVFRPLSEGRMSPSFSTALGITALILLLSSVWLTWSIFHDMPNQSPASTLLLARFQQVQTPAHGDPLGYDTPFPFWKLPLLVLPGLMLLTALAMMAGMMLERFSTALLAFMGGAVLSLGVLLVGVAPLTAPSLDEPTAHDWSRWALPQLKQGAQTVLYSTDGRLLPMAMFMKSSVTKDRSDLHSLLAWIPNAQQFERTVRTGEQTGHHVIGMMTATDYYTLPANVRLQLRVVPYGSILRPYGIWQWVPGAWSGRGSKHSPPESWQILFFDVLSPDETALLDQF